MALVELETDIHEYYIEEAEVDIEFPFYMRDSIYFYKFLNEYECLVIYVSSRNGKVELREYPNYFEVESFDDIGEVHTNGDKILDAINNNYNCRVITEEEFTEKLELYNDYSDFMFNTKKAPLNKKELSYMMKEFKRNEKVNNLLS